MKILVLLETNWLEKGPAQHHHLMDRLSKRGHEIHVIDYDILWREKEWSLFKKRRIFKNISKSCQGARVTVIRPSILCLPILDYASVGYFHMLEIIREVNSFKPDVLVGFDILNTYIGLKIANTKRIPFVYYLIDALHTLIPVKQLQPIGKLLEMKTLRHSDVVLVINEELKRYAINLGADPSKIHVIRAGVDSRRFNPYIKGSTVREKYDIKPGDIVLFFMGWLYNFSGLKEVAHSLADYKGKPEIKLLVVGKGDLYEELLNLKIGKLGDRLILVDWQPYEKIPEFIAASDICLFPAYNNEVTKHIVPIKIYEYMACGKPVIATRLPGIMKEFGEGNGMIYVERPEEVLSKAVELAEDRQKMRELGLKAARCVQRYSWESITDQFEKLLEKLIESKSKAGKTQY